MPEYIDVHIVIHNYATRKTRQFASLAKRSEIHCAGSIETEQVRAAQGGLHTMSIVHLVKPLSYDIKLDDQATDWGWFKELPEN